MSNEDLDLTGQQIDVQQLAADLRASRVKVDELLEARRHDMTALGKIASAAGVLDFETLDELAEGVIARLQLADLVAPAPKPEPTPAPATEPTGLACEECGADDAIDMGDGVVLCPRCNGDIVLEDPS